MGFGKKLVTLINATLRGGVPRFRKHDRSPSGDPESQLKAIQAALTEVEAKEQEVAERLKATQTKIDAAVVEGNREEAMAQRRLAHELEAHLQTQSTEAVRLSEKLAVIEAQLDAEKTDEDQPGDRADAQETRVQSPERQPPPSDDELAARKSRLSG